MRAMLLLSMRRLYGLWQRDRNGCGINSEAAERVARKWQNKKAGKAGALCRRGKKGGWEGYTNRFFYFGRFGAFRPRPISNSARPPSLQRPDPAPAAAAYIY